MPSRLWPLLVVLAWLCLLVPSLEAQQSYCADCHFANPDAPNRRHIDEWSLSKHGQANVGCERCHGGDPSTTERGAAHVGLIRSSQPASPVNHVNLPRTCGTCHAGPFSQFQQSRHYALLLNGDRSGPTCTTCHDSVSADLVSARGLEQRCQQCHGATAPEPRPGRAASARLMLEQISDLRESLRAANRLIDRVSDPGRRESLEAASEQAEVPLTQARDAGHRFVFDELEARLGVARERTALLMQLLVDPQ